MPTPNRAQQEKLLERVMELAEREAEILARRARWRPLHEEPGRRVREPERVTPDHLLHWARQMTESLIRARGLTGGAGAASKLWSRVRALIMAYHPDWTVDEFVLYNLIKDQYGDFPFGLAVRDLINLAGDEFTDSQVRSAVNRLSRKKLIRRCYSRRARVRPGSIMPTREHVWFYAGPSSKHAESPDRVYYMNTPWGERPQAAEAAASRAK